MDTSLGPATLLIDSCFAVKLTLCRHVDGACGFKGTEIWSFQGYLQYCYGMRRPSFELVDMLLGFQPTPR